MSHWPLGLHCFTDCTSNSNCASGYLCSNQLCAKQCSITEPCETGLACANGICSLPCEENSQCLHHQHCLQGQACGLLVSCCQLFLVLSTYMLQLLVFHHHVVLPYVYGYYHDTTTKIGNHTALLLL